ncbi:MAG: hypothetical protein WC741_03440 [Patescibacteria group bacterium]|jgi:hypothetical protein
MSLSQRLEAGINSYQNRVRENGGIPTTSETVKQALLKGGIGQAFQSYYRVCLRRGINQAEEVETQFGTPPRKGHKLLAKTFAGLFATIGPLEAVITLAGGGKKLDYIYANTPVVDWVGNKKIKNDNSSNSNSYSSGSAWPEGITESEKNVAEFLFQSLLSKGVDVRDARSAVSKAVEKVAKIKEEKNN